MAGGGREEEEAGGRRQEAGGRRQEAGGGRWEVGGSRREQEESTSAFASAAATVGLAAFAVRLFVAASATASSSLAGRLRDRRPSIALAGISFAASAIYRCSFNESHPS